MSDDDPEVCGQDPVVLAALYGRIAGLAVRSGADPLAVSRYLVNALDPRLSPTERGVIVSSIARAIVSAEGGPSATTGGADEARRDDPSGRMRALHLGVRERYLEARTAYVTAQIRAAARHPRAG